MGWLLTLTAIIVIMLYFNKKGKTRWKNSIMQYGLSLPYREPQMADVIKNTMIDFRDQFDSMLAATSLPKVHLKIECLFCLSFLWHTCMYTLIRSKGVQSNRMNEIDLKNIISILSDDIPISNCVYNECTQAYSYFQNAGIPLPREISKKDFYTALEYIKFFVSQ